MLMLQMQYIISLNVLCTYILVFSYFSLLLTLGGLLGKFEAVFPTHHFLQIKFGGSTLSVRRCEIVRGVIPLIPLPPMLAYFCIRLFWFLLISMDYVFGVLQMVPNVVLQIFVTLNVWMSFNVK